MNPIKVLIKFLELVDKKPAITISFYRQH